MRSAVAVRASASWPRTAFVPRWVRDVHHPTALNERLMRSSTEVSSREPVEWTPPCVCYGKHENAARADLKRKRIRESV